MTPLQDAAMQYAQAGYPVLPVWGLRDGGKTCRCPKGGTCTSAGKHAIEKAWPTRATTDPEKAKAMFARFPSAQIGIMPPEGCVIIDVDPRNGGKQTLNRLLNGHKLPATPVQRSGGGGIHIVFEGAIPAPLGQGIDIKRPGRGYVVAAPAEHISGGTYTWKVSPWDVKKPAPVPAAWLRSAAPAAAEDLHAAPPLLKHVREALTFIPADDYDAAWIKYGQALKHSYGEAGYAPWIAWSKTCPEKWCGESEARTKWRSFDRNPGVRPVTAWSIIADAKKHGYVYAPEFEAAAPATAPTAMVLKSSTALATLDLPEVKVFVPKLVTAGLTVMFGRAKVGKSWLMLDLARALSTGGTFLGQRVVKAKVLYLALEDNERRMKARIAKLGMAKVEFDYTTQAPRIDQGLASELSKAIEQRGYEVVIIDTLAAISPATQGKKGVWLGDYDTMTALHRLTQRANVAILVVSHTKKNSDNIDSQDAHMGTTGMQAGVDTSWVIQKRAGGAGGAGGGAARMVLTVSGRDIEGEEYAVRFDRVTATWQMLGRAAQVVYSAQQQEILQTLRGSAGPLRHAELKRTCGGLGANFNAQLARLEAKGLVERDAQGRYTLASLEDIFGE